MNRTSNNASAPSIPDHLLIRRIGVGSYGEIWLARNVIGTYRAVKIVYRKNFDTAAPYDREFNGIQRFEPISRSHPGLVDILQIGRNDEAGYFYYVMELADDEVAGTQVHPDTYCAKTLSSELAARGRLPALESTQIGISLASALAHLHKAQLIHRDIKPANIIFVQGQPKLADIGLVVRVADAQTFVGTEGYIPPEGPGHIQADIYSLGKVLYELSTGQHRDCFPELPAEVAEFEDREALIELNEVVVKACAPQARNRYESADVLQRELEMVFAGRSVKQLHFVERQLRHVKRLALAAALVALAAVAAAYAVNRVRVREKELLARAYINTGAQLLQEGALHSSIPWFAEAMRLEAHDPTAVMTHRTRIGTALRQGPQLLRLFEHGAPVRDLCFTPDGRLLITGGDEWLRVMDVESGELRFEHIMSEEIASLACSPDGRFIAVGQKKSVSLLRAETGEEVFSQAQDEKVSSVQFSRDGQTLLLGCHGACVHFISARNGRPVGKKLNGHRGPVRQASFSPDERQVVTASQDGTARLWDVATGKTIAELPHAEWVQDAAFSPDGSTVVTASSDHTVFVWSLTPKPHVRWRLQHRGDVQRARFSPDGRWLVTASMDHTVRLWDVQTGRPVGGVIPVALSTLHAIFSPEGRRVAVADQSGRVRLWDLFAHSSLYVGRGAVSADGERYVTFRSNQFRVFDARSDRPLTEPVTVPVPITSLLTSKDAGVVVALGAASLPLTNRVFAHRQGSKPIALQAPFLNKRMWLSPDGRYFFADEKRQLAAIETATGRELSSPFTLPFDIKHGAFSPDGRLFAVSGERAVTVIDVRSGAMLWQPLSIPRRASVLQFSADATRLLVGDADGDFTPGSVLLVDVRAGTRLLETTSHSDGLRSGALLKNGAVALTGGEDRAVILWDTKTGATIAEPLKLLRQIQSVAVSPDEEWFIATSYFESFVCSTRHGRPVTPMLRIPGDSKRDESGFCAGNERVWVKCGQSLYLWPLPRTPFTADECLAIAQELGVIVPTTMRWTKPATTAGLLARACQEAWRNCEETLPGWHLEQASAAEASQQWFGAQFHLTRLANTPTADATLLARLRNVETQLQKLADGSSR